MKSKGWTWIAGLAIVSSLLLAAGCDRATSTAVPEPSPAVEQPTAGPSPTSTPVPPMATPSPTPIPVPPTPTPVPPTPTETPSPTPTPTAAELQIRELGWYEDEGTDQDAKANLVRLLIDASVAYPLLFDALIEKSWLNPGDIPESLSPISDVVHSILAVKEEGGSEESVVRVLAMPFLDNLDGDEATLLQGISYVTGTDEESLGVFLDYVIANDGLSDGDGIFEVYYWYMRANDESSIVRIFGEEMPDARGGHDEYVLSRVIELYSTYPAAYRATSEHFSEAVSINLVSNVIRLAMLDKDVARRLAEMPFNSFIGGSGNFAWFAMYKAAYTDQVAAQELVQKYGMQGGVGHPEMPLFLLEAAAITAPDAVNEIRALEWVKDGLAPGRFVEYDLGPGWINSSEEDMLVSVLAGALEN